MCVHVCVSVWVGVGAAGEWFWRVGVWVGVGAVGVWLGPNDEPEILQPADHWPSALTTHLSGDPPCVGGEQLARSKSRQLLPDVGVRLTSVACFGRLVGRTCHVRHNDPVTAVFACRVAMEVQLALGTGSHLFCWCPPSRTPRWVPALLVRQVDLGT